MGACSSTNEVVVIARDNLTRKIVAKSWPIIRDFCDLDEAVIVKKKLDSIIAKKNSVLVYSIITYKKYKKGQGLERL